MTSYWNAPLCNYCWGLANPDRVPVRLVHPDKETCSNCGGITQSGIYVRQAR